MTTLQQEFSLEMVFITSNFDVITMILIYCGSE